MKQTLKITLCLVLALLCLTQPVLAVGANTNTTAALQPSTAEILNAVEPLVEAQAKYYDFRHISVENVVTTMTADGTAQTTCTVVFTMTLKADSVEELPHVAGMLSELGMETAAECYSAVANANIAAMNSTQLVAYNIQAQSAAQIEDYAEYIGEETTLAFSLLLIGDSAGNITQVLGVGETDESGNQIRLPLSSYFPQTEETMFCNGVNAIRDIATAVTVTAVPVIGNQYDRIAARDYAMRWSSEAPASSRCDCGYAGYVDSSKYNPMYKDFCHNDCANFVSQALHAGGVPSDSVWCPYTSAWINVNALHDYMYNIKGYWLDSTYASCNAGGVIVNRTPRGGRPHVNMCVLNDTVNRAYAAHTNDHRYQAYTIDHWSGDLSFGARPDYYIVSVIDPSIIMSIEGR